MPKIKIDIRMVEALLVEQRRINALPLHLIEWVDSETGKTVTPPISKIRSWKFTGLNNLYFVDFVLLRKGL